jgi:O-antigen ligase
MIGMVISMFAFSNRLGRSNIYGSYGTVIFIIIILAFEIGLMPVLDRFSVDPMEDLRWEIYSIGLRIIGDYFPVGSGMGTFSAVYLPYQTPNLDRLINHAHNDYLQWVLEGGLPVLLIIGMGLFRYFGNWRCIWVSGSWGGFRFIQVGAGVGVLLVLLHSMIDFSLHKPANNICFAFFLAVFLKANKPEDNRKRHQ